MSYLGYFHYVCEPCQVTTQVRCAIDLGATCYHCGEPMRKQTAAEVRAMLTAIQPKPPRQVPAVRIDPGDWETV